MSQAENAAAKKNLEGRLTQMSIPFVAGIGEDSAGMWLDESSVLALDISLDEALTSDRHRYWAARHRR